MANQIKNKYIEDNAIDGDKLLLLSNQTLRKEDGSGGEIDVISVLESADSTLQSNIDSEASARAGADSSLQTAIDAEKTRVDAILSASQADKDSFAEIVTLINSVDTENDTAFAGYVLSNDAALAQEISDRQAGDSALDTRVTALENDEEVLVYNSLAAFPASGEASKIYVAKDTNKIYHWVETSGGGESFDHTVGASGDFADLATALADASVLDGHKIKVLNGTYDLSAQLVISKQVQIFGESKAGVILQSSADTNAPPVLIAVQVDNVALVNMTIKHRKTNNTSIETAVGVSGTGWPQARVDGFIMSGCLVEHVEFGLTIRGSNYAVVDSEISYTGPVNSTRRAIGLYGNAGQSFILRNSFLNNSESGNLRAIAMTSTSGSNPNETYEGSLAVEDNIHSGALQQFISMDAFQEGAEKFTLLAKRNMTNETSAFISLYSGTANFADLFEKIVVEANQISNLHSSSEAGGKGLIGIDGWGSNVDISTLALPVESKDNVLGQPAFRSDYEEMVGSSGSIVGQKIGAITGDVSLSATISATPSEPTYPSLGGGSAEQYAELSEQVDLSGLEADLAAEESARQSADSTLQANIDAEETARLAGDSALQSAIDTEKGRIDAILSASEADKDSFAEIVTLINSVDTENDTAFAGYVASNDAALAQEVSDRQSGDSALSARLDVLEAQEAEEVFAYDDLASFPATGEDSKLYVAKDTSLLYHWKVDQYVLLSSKVDYEKESFTADATMVTNGYVDLSHEVEEKSLMLHVGRLAGFVGEDYTLSVVGGVTRVTFAGSFASGGEEAVAAGDKIKVSYSY